MAKEIPLTRGLVTIVDDADYDYLMHWKWHAVKHGGYSFCAASWNGGDRLLMHRLILGLDDSLEVDHRDGNALNNRRYNLRTATRSQNLFNRKVQKNNKSGYKGVYFRNERGTWQATINFEGKMYRLGSYKTDVDAALAYDDAAKVFHGEFAKLNFNV